MRTIAALAAVVAAGCAPHQQRAGLQAVSLPDLSRMAPSAQTQIRDSYKALTQKIATRSTTVVELADAYGEFGKLLMAADQRDAAKPCFLNAQTLAPADFHAPRTSFFASLGETLNHLLLVDLYYIGALHGDPDHGLVGDRYVAAADKSSTSEKP